jgi:hypothetical protein
VKDALTRLALTALCLCALIGSVLVLLSYTQPGAADARAQELALSMEHRAAWAPLDLALGRIWRVFLIVALAALSVMFTSAAVASTGVSAATFRKAGFWAHLVRPQDGQVPAYFIDENRPHIQLLAPHRNVTAETAAALVSGSLDRLQAGAVRALLTEPAQVAGIPEQPELSASQLLAEYDPNRAPHWLCIGDTGSGKSSAVFMIVDALRKRFQAECIVLEKGGNNWNQQAAAITPAGYVEAFQRIEAERERREALIRAEDCQEADRLQQPPPFLIVVVEEAETVFRDVVSLGRAQSNLYTDTVRTLAAMGRKQRIVLVVATTSGTGQVFDVPTRRNLGNKLVFRSEPATGDLYSIPREVGLPRLLTGTAYSLTHGRLVSFPHTSRPTLPLSPLYREPILLDAHAPLSIDTGDTVSPVLASPPLVFADTVDTVSLAGATGSDELSDAQRQLILDTWRACKADGRPYLNEVQRRLFPQQRMPGGNAYRIIEPVVREYFTAQGKRPPWERR